MASAFIVLLAVSFSGAARGSPTCRGAGLSTDAPLYYLIDVPWDYTGGGEPPSLPDGPESREAGRKSIGDVSGEEGSVVFILRAAGEEAPPSYPDQDAL